MARSKGRKAQVEKAKDPVRVKFGAHMRTLREKARERDPGLSVRGLAGRLGVQPAYISRVETGEDPISQEVAVKVAKILGEDPDFFYIRAGRITDELLEAIADQPEEFVKLIRDFRGKSKEKFAAASRLVRDGKW